jgi:hypothetical protein
LSFICSHLQEEIAKSKINLFAIDVTPKPRLYSKTLQDRGYVHCSEAVPGKKPITVGHNYSCVAYLPNDASRWALPLDIKRVSTNEKGTLVGIQQWLSIISNPNLGFQNKISVGVGDCAYSSVQSLYLASRHENSIFVARLRKNRVLMRPMQEINLNKKGHPVWYDQSDPFNLQEAETWREPSNKIEVVWTTKKGKNYMVTIQSWSDLRTKGARGCPMHDVPLTALRISVKDEENKPVFVESLWLVVVGAKATRLEIETLWYCYKSRFDIEHFFRFGKLHLLMNAYQTPDTVHEENWMQYVILSYHQLFHARQNAQHIRNPWEQKNQETKPLSPSQVLRDMPRLLKISGPLSLPVRSRGIPQGRTTGELIGNREPQNIVVKLKKSNEEKPSILIKVAFDKDNQIQKHRIKCNGVELEELPSTAKKIITSIKAILPHNNGPPH